MSRNIHPTALVDRAAELGEDVEIGPYCIVEAGARLGPRTRLFARAHVCGAAELGADCQVHMGAVVANAPQDLSFKHEPTRALLGDRVIVRENVTIHRATKSDHPTTIGDDCFLMAGSHVAHDCALGRGVILVNGALLAGHVQIEDFAIVSGNTVIHQFVRIGRLAMLSGNSGFGLDVPPYLIGDGINTVTHLNRVGLRRCKELSDGDREQIRRAFRVLYRSDLDLPAALDRLRKEFTSPAVAHWVEWFTRPSKRGCCRFKASRREAGG